MSSSTSFGTLRSVGTLTYEKAERIYDKRIKSKDYKYLCDSTRLYKRSARGYDDAYVVDYGGTHILTIVPWGWYVERVASYDISLNNRLNTYVGAHIFSHKGVTYAGSTRNVLTEGKFLSHEHGYKYPLTWHGSHRWYRTPHSGANPSAIYGRRSRIGGDSCLSDPDHGSMSRHRVLLKLVLKSYVHYYVRNFMSFKLADVADRDAFEACMRVSPGIKSPKNPWKRIYETDHAPEVDNAQICWDDIIDENRILVSEAVAPKGYPSVGYVNTKFADYIPDFRYKSALQGLDAIAGKSVTAEMDDNGIPEAIDMHRIDPYFLMSGLSRYPWGSADYDYMHERDASFGVIRTIDEARYAMIRNSALHDLCNYLSAGSQFFCHSLDGNRSLTNPDGNSVTNRFLVTSLGRHWLHEDDLRSRFNARELSEVETAPYSGWSTQGVLIPEFPQDYGHCEDIANHNTYYPRSFLLTIMECYGCDMDYVRSLYDSRSETFSSYAETVMYDFLESKFDSFLFPFLRQYTMEALFQNSTMSEDWFLSNNDSHGQSRPYWHRRRGDRDFSLSLEKKVSELHDWS